MKRAMLGLALAASTTALVDPFDNRAKTSCGNCFEEDADGFLRCNTGGSDDKIPFSTSMNETMIQLLKSEEHKDKLAEHGWSTAEVKQVSDIRDLIGTQKYDRMFCSSYLNLYKDGTWVEAGGVTPENEGAMCVSNFNAEAILNVDKEARTLYEHLGTENGFPSSYTEAKGTPFDEEQRAWGTEFVGDVPANWCGTYFKYMLCAVAFPQVQLSQEEIQVRSTNATTDRAVDEDGDVPYKFIAEGAIRPVSYENCETLFASCSRYEPLEDVETESDYILPSMNHARGTFFQDQDPEERENAMDISLYCSAWSRGFGLAQAGTSVVDNTGNGYVEFSAAGTSTLSFLAIFAVVLAHLF